MLGQVLLVRLVVMAIFNGYIDWLHNEVMRLVCL